MENIFYILVGIAWVAYSVYSARQKALQKQQSAGMPPQGPSQSSPLPIPGNQGGGKSVFEDIFRELTGEPKPVEPVNQPVIINQPVITKQPVKEKNISDLGTKYEGYSGYKFISGAQNEYTTRDAENDRIKADKSEELIKNDISKENFDLRKAVIYSELLNRKYF
jgi:hypothetical protein